MDTMNKNFLHNDTQYNDTKELTAWLTKSYGAKRAAHMMKGEGTVDLFRIYKRH
ncbi:hypothetical protein [Acetilactobacillus jinshanensis]|uniref:hypothetical protein n=1 Tax=Acetilactobacillus jinshanensis TaxID=1720083 RepID=UPI0013A6254C|nr:hypothetical protein [Acetilactobacillus jinshanensis]URL61022.1 hypothetical protein HGK75_03220 [uncultured bacterium]